MKKLYPLLSVLFLIYWSCEDEQDTITLWGTDYSIENTTELDLGGQGLTGSIPPEIGSLTNLRHLYLDNNQLTGPIPSEIGNLKNLTRLYLKNNQFTGVIPEGICDLDINWSSSNSFTISNNQLCILPYPSCIEDYVGEQDTSDCEELWGEVYSIENTTELDLSNSGLIGEILPEIGNLTNLTHLYLDDNQLTGSIPPEIGNLTNLISLTLYNNQLTGIIPDEICNQGDSSPGLSNNQFCPPYPSCVEDFVGYQDTSDCD